MWSNFHQWKSKRCLQEASGKRKARLSLPVDLDEEAYSHCTPDSFPTATKMPSHRMTPPLGTAEQRQREPASLRTLLNLCVSHLGKLILLLDCLVSEHFWIFYDHLGEDLVSILTETAEVIYTSVGHQPGMLKRLPRKRMTRMEIWAHYTYDYIQFWIPAID